ncbi:MAG: enoyl-CoA hydratase/isomerase family protein [Anaerolineae bacterium]|nr:enoyl-CoA hydratase/isomerase family protein [Anaerolineae bacterium]
MQELVSFRLSGRVAILTISNPPANALSMATLDALEAAFRRALETPEAKVVIITGEGKLFSAGANIKELAALQGRADAEALSRKGQALCELIETSPKPVIAAINGRFALGGGTELIMACHLRLAEASTQIGSPEVRLGLMVGWGGSQRLPRLVGVGRALELLLTGKRISAQEAAAIGLVNQVVPDGTVLEHALELANQLAELSAPVLAATLEAVRTGIREGFARGIEVEAQNFGQLCENHDWHEGTQAFLEKRPPHFIDG